jgi:hypothetical protein
MGCVLCIYICLERGTCIKENFSEMKACSHPVELHYTLALLCNRVFSKTGVRKCQKLNGYLQSPRQQSSPFHSYRVHRK